MNARGHVVMAATAAILAVAAPAFAASWTAAGNAEASSRADSLSEPSAALVGSASSSTLTISVTGAPTSGPAPTAYRVDRTSSVAPGPAIGVCTIAATGGINSCTDTGLSAATPYSYVIYSQIGAKWISSGSTAASGATAAAISSPKITSPSMASPKTISHTGSTAFTIVGTNFDVGVLVSTSNSDYAVVSSSRTSSTAISVTMTNTTGNNGNSFADLIVTNPDGGTYTATAALANK